MADQQYLTRALLCSAIQSHKRIQFDYRGGRRLADPYILGKSHQDQFILLVQQIAGYVPEGEQRGWLVCPVKAISNLGITDDPIKKMNRAVRRYFSHFHTVTCSLDELNLG